MIGLRGIKVERPDQIDDAWDEAFAADRPVIIDALTTPDEPPIPPHVTREEAEALMKSLVKDPSGAGRGRWPLSEKCFQGISHPLAMARHSTEAVARQSVSTGWRGTSSTDDSNGHCRE